MALGQTSQGLNKDLEEKRGIRRWQASQTSQCSKNPRRHDLKKYCSPFPLTRQGESEHVLRNHTMPNILIPRLGLNKRSIWHRS